jgi:hypothetical protein
MTMSGTAKKKKEGATIWSCPCLAEDEYSNSTKRNWNLRDTLVLAGAGAFS